MRIQIGKAHCAKSKGMDPSACHLRVGMERFEWWEPGMEAAGFLFAPGLFWVLGLLAAICNRMCGFPSLFL